MCKTSSFQYRIIKKQKDIMANNDLKEQEILQQQKVEQGVSAVETFFNENKNTIWGVLAAIVIIGLAVLAYQKFYAQPKIAEAQEQMFPAENAFAASDFETALNGDGNALGFAEIVKEYGTKAGKDVYMYAGICALNLGNYDDAVNYLKKYSGKDEILAAKALGCLGDAYVGLEKYSTALGCYDKAAAKADNIFAASYLLKAGVVCEEMGQSAKALEYYKKIKDQYSSSIEGYDIDKYISRIESAQ